MKRFCYVLSAALFAILAMTACSQDSLLDESEVDMSSKVELNGQELANSSSGKTAVFIPASSINRALSLTMY